MFGLSLPWILISGFMSASPLQHVEEYTALIMASIALNMLLLFVAGLKIENARKEPQS